MSTDTAVPLPTNNMAVYMVLLKQAGKPCQPHVLELAPEAKYLSAQIRSIMAFKKREEKRLSEALKVIERCRLREIFTYSTVDFIPSWSGHLGAYLAEREHGDHTTWPQHSGIRSLYAAIGYRMKSQQYIQQKQD